MKKIFFVCSIICTLYGCRESKQQDTATSGMASLSETIEVDLSRSVTLTPEALQEVSQWLAYVTAQNEISDIKSATGHRIISSSGPLVEIMESLSSTIPDTLQVTPVKTRTNVLLTKAHVLHQLASKNNRNPEEIFEAANKLISEFNNFKLQLNERFLKSPEDFELELDRKFEESQDSVRRAQTERDSTDLVPRDSI